MRWSQVAATENVVFKINRFKFLALHSQYDAVAVLVPLTHKKTGGAVFKSPRDLLSRPVPTITLLYRSKRLRSRYLLAL